MHLIILCTCVIGGILAIYWPSSVNLLCSKTFTNAVQGCQFGMGALKREQPHYSAVCSLQGLWIDSLWGSIEVCTGAEQQPCTESPVSGAPRQWDGGVCDAGGKYFDTAAVSEGSVTIFELKSKLSKWINSKWMMCLFTKHLSSSLICFCDFFCKYPSLQTKEKKTFLPLKTNLPRSQACSNP